MEKRQIKEGIFWLGAIDWERRLFDSLIPLPDGTTYNAYLIRGSSKTALLDTVDPPMADVWMDQLSGFSPSSVLTAGAARPWRPLPA